jgi:GT2 family glycosyltransferase
MSPTVTVIIPTYNRAEILRQTLEGYARQRGDHRIREILVIDDGSKDHTRDVVREARSPFPLRYLHQQNAGLAAARNHAFREARGELLLFGDDDIIPSPQLTAEHVRFHDVNPEREVGVLGYVPWLPQKRSTPFMQWSSHYGPQFNFGYFSAEKPLGFQHGYFCNTTVYKSFLEEHGIFSESFKTYGYEDIELSYRLCKQGYKILYAPTAIGYHNKFETFEDTLVRVEKLYQSWPEFAKTEAGKSFLKLWQDGRAQAGRVNESATKKMLRPLKNAMVPIFRQVIDSHIPFPNWIYEQVFYHYVTSFEEVVDLQAARTADAA